MKIKLITILSVIILSSFLSCGGGGGSGDSGSEDGIISTVPWAWISGSELQNQPGVYGTKGTPDPANIPGARSGGVCWTDSSGNIWLFGGKGYDSTGNQGYLNDLWKFDGTAWTWVSGSNTISQNGEYGTKGTAAAANVPGARSGCVCLKDSSENIWIFGGMGYADTGSTRDLNDLWKFNGTNWTWVSGGKVGNEYGTYGTKGTAAAANVPGARENSTGWIDSSNHIWIFGGTGQAVSPDSGYLNDLWKFDGTNWTWVSGSNQSEQFGVYGTKGTAAAVNIPGSRGRSTGWIDSDGNLWLFGGSVRVSVVTHEVGNYNDLWKFNTTDLTWTWISGSNTLHQAGVYGTLGVASHSNIPGARENSISWVDSDGNFLLFGGLGADSSNYDGTLNDLWKFDGTDWIWISGSRKRTQNGVYGTQGVSSKSNIPDARSESTGCIDSDGNLWIFGGKWVNYVDDTTGLYNDLWKCELN